MGTTIMTIEEILEGPEEAATNNRIIKAIRIAYELGKCKGQNEIFESIGRQVFQYEHQPNKKLLELIDELMNHEVKFPL